MDTYVKPLTNDEQIFGILLSKINIPQLSKYILNLKKEMEEKETLEYHEIQWENIVGCYFNVRDSYSGTISYIINDKNYVINKDYLPDFYNITGISYQVVDMIFEIIKISENKHRLKHNDYLYGILAKKIMVEMNGINLKNKNIKKDIKRQKQ